MLPSDLKEEFGKDMLWIIDQESGNRIHLVTDVACSVLRQRLLMGTLCQSAIASVTALLPYLFGLQVWKELTYASQARPSQDAELRSIEIAVVVTLFVRCVVAIVWLRRATNQDRGHTAISWRETIVTRLGTRFDGESNTTGRDRSRVAGAVLRSLRTTAR